jgi:predicted DNA-binding transcriptional regulator YafY
MRSRGVCDRKACDRISDVNATDETFDPPADFQLGSVLHDGRVVSGETENMVRIRYSARIARWLSEREEGTTLDDGSFVAEYPLLDSRWAVGHVLQYGDEAEVLEPAEVRREVCSVLRALSAGPARDP